MKVGGGRKPQTGWVFNGDHLITLLLPARKLSLVGELPGANVKSYAGYLTVNKEFNSNLFFWFFPAVQVGVKPSVQPKGHARFRWGSAQFVVVFIVCQ